MSELYSKKPIIKAKEKIKKFIPQFIENTKADIDKLKTALEVKDYESVHATAHSMKGYGKPFGFTEISETAAKIQILADQKQYNETKELVDYISWYMDNVTIEYI